MAAEAAEQVGPGGVEQVVAVEVQAVDNRRPGTEPSPHIYERRPAGSTPDRGFSGALLAGPALINSVMARSLTGR